MRIDVLLFEHRDYLCSFWKIAIFEIINMKTVDTIRTRLIDKILAIHNADFLKALDILVSSSSQAGKVRLSKEQKEMLEMSENDISADRLISHDKLDFEDNEWLKEK